MIEIPENTIAAISFDPMWQKQEYLDQIFMSLKNQSKREWFVDHAYHCLPLVIGNQYGFVVKSLWDFEVIWKGGGGPQDVEVKILSEEKEYKEKEALQSVKSHFGMGTITVQTPFTLRTAPGINLMTINPPNYFIDGLYHMNGVVEADNLRRDFTYNIRITRPNHKIQVNKGDYIGCVIPYPRHFIDQYRIINAEDIFQDNLLQQERDCSNDMGHERANVDIHKKGRNGKRYWRGTDVYDNKFPDHQTSLDKYL